MRRIVRQGGDSTSKAEQAGNKQETPPRRLYRILDGAMIAGVCNGIAASFKVDVTLVRIAFVIAAFVTKGVAVIAYILMMFFVPEAKTPEARAAAAGTPFNAKEIIDRAKQVAKGQKKEWRRQWRQQRRQWQRYG